MIEPASLCEQIDSYVLVTAAHNEEAYIENAINSVLHQKIRPLRWIIVSDGSSDNTDLLVQKYSDTHPFISLLRINARHQQNFAAKAHAIGAGYDSSKSLSFAFIGILDADVSLERDYYEQLIRRFKNDSRLGLTGGFIYERKGKEFCSRRGNRTWSVAGATQFFRRECYEQIGGILPLKYGGEDWCAEVNARMAGWTVKAIPELKVFHHRATGTTENLLRYLYRQGKMDYSLGCLPTFEIVKCGSRLSRRPVVLGGFARLGGFLLSYFRDEDRAVSKDFVRFLRNEQTRQLLSLIPVDR